jgi:hypothetical protein
MSRVDTPFRVKLAISTDVNTLQPTGPSDILSFNASSVQSESVPLMADVYSDDDLFDLSFVDVVPRPLQCSHRSICRTCTSGTVFRDADEDFSDDDLSDTDLFAALEKVTHCTSPPQAIVIADDGGSEIPHENRKYSIDHTVPEVWKNPLPSTSSSARYSDFGEEEFEDCDLNDVALVALMAAAEQKPLQQNAVDAAADAITIARVDFQNALNQAYAAGRKSYHVDWRKRNVFDLLKLPAEIRMTIYEYALQDQTFDSTQKTRAIANRVGSSFYWNMSPRPVINVGLLRTCRQIYFETRDGVLYKDRHFSARIDQFDAVLREFAPSMRHWQYIQHLQLTLNDNGYNRYRKVPMKGNLQHIVALLWGGRHLQSFHLDYMLLSSPNAIEAFEDLHVPGSITINQTYSESRVGLSEQEDLQTERALKLQSLVLRMRRLPREYFPVSRVKAAI